MGQLDGKVVIVSGGARGMGAAHAARMVSEGAKVVIADRRIEEGQALAASLGDNCLFVELDVRAAGQWSNAVSAAVRAFGDVTCLVNNAGILLTHRLETATENEWQQVIDTNQLGTFLGMRAVIPSMRRAGAGAVVNISSTAGIKGYTDCFAYLASKWAIRGMTKAAALELAPAGIRVNSVHPGDVLTPMITELEAPAGAVPGFDEIPLARFGESQEITNLVVFLLSDQASYVTGAEYVIDGGATAG